MTLDEAIDHAKKCAESMMPVCSMEQCGREHLQLATWLEELKDRRRTAFPEDVDCYELHQALKGLKEAIYGHGYRQYETVDDDDPLYKAYNTAENLLERFAERGLRDPPYDTDVQPLPTDWKMFGKYEIRKRDGKPLKGRKYFVLRLDSPDPAEFMRVSAALCAYTGGHPEKIIGESK